MHRVLGAAPPVTVIQAPLGFGKTTLVAHWLNRLPGPDHAVVWVDAPREGGDLWTEILAMMRISGLVDFTDIPGPAALAQLLPATPIILVVDAFDRVHSRDAQHILLDLVRRSSALRLIVCTRRPPRLLLRSRSELDQILLTGRDLAFTPDETRQLLHTEGLAIHELTGGWPILNRMVADALAESPDRPAADVAAAASSEFLRSSVLPALNHEPLIQFILDTSVLDEITVETAGLVADRADAESWLNHLESAGVIDVDTAGSAGNGPHYRWPPAARAALQDELLRRTPERAAELQDRLATWHEQAGRPGPALTCATKAQNWPLAARIIESHWSRLLVAHRDALDTGLTQLPRKFVVSRPRVVAIRDIRLRLRNEPGEDLLLTMPSPLPSQRPALDALASSPEAYAAMDTAFALTTALRVRGRHREAKPYAQMCERILQVAMVTRPADIVQRRPPVLMGVGLTRMLGGDTSGAETTLRDAYECEPVVRAPYVAADAAGKLSVVHALNGDVVQASRWLRRHDAADPGPDEWIRRRVKESGATARALIAIAGLDRQEATALVGDLEEQSEIEQSWNALVAYAHARHALFWGDRYDALARLRASRERLSDWLGPDATMRPLCDAVEADLLIALGAGHQASRVISAAPRHPALAAPELRLSLLAGDLDKAVRNAPIERSEDAMSRQVQAELLMIRAAALLRADQQGDAVRSLRDALAGIRTSGSMSALAAIPQRDLVLLFEQLPAPPAWINLRAVPEVFPSHVEMLRLTDRERLVLAHIARGLTTRQTADALFVSYNTVKSQLRSLYGKLGASSRNEVIDIARRRGLIVDADIADGDGVAGKPLPYSARDDGLGVAVNHP